MTKRSGDDAKPRAARLVHVMHAEAFQLMLYRNEYKLDGANRIAVSDARELWIWNSRDGVTPFGTTHDGLEYTHAMNSYQPRYTAVLPPEAQFVWVDYSPEAWRDLTHKRWQRYLDLAGDFHDPAKFREEFPTPESFERAAPFEPGQPRSITRVQFLETTNSWHGRIAEEAA